MEGSVLSHKELVSPSLVPDEGHEAVQMEDNAPILCLGCVDMRLQILQHRQHDLLVATSLQLVVSRMTHDAHIVIHNVFQLLLSVILHKVVQEVQSRTQWDVMPRHALHCKSINKDML